MKNAVEGYILSYTNPDTDGVCSSIAYSIYMAKKGLNYQVLCAGAINAETQYVLRLLHMDAPLCDVAYDAKKKVVLMDTHHLSQLPHLVNAENVVRVFDHHPGGDDDVFVNATIDNRAIGAAASIIAQMILQHLFSSLK